MAADVSSLRGILSRYKEERGGGVVEGKGNKGDLVTRDLLGGCGAGAGAAVLGSKKELDLDRQGPSGWEKRLDLKSGKVYFQRTSSSDQVHRQLQDLNLPPLCSALPPPRPALPFPNLLQEDSASAAAAAAAMDLKLLLPSSAPPPPPAEYQSVCTLEKVKSALERAGRESRGKKQQREREHQGHPSDGSASPTSSATTTSSVKRRRGSGGGMEVDGDSRSSSSSAVVEKQQLEAAAGVGGGVGGQVAMAAAGCPSCLLYVLISRSNPRCPGCDSAVPLPPPLQNKKQPRIDLNTTTAAAAATPTTSTRTVNFF